MKFVFRLLIAITTILILLSSIGCSSKKNYDYLSKDIILLRDVEKLFKDDGIKLISKKSENSVFEMLQKKHSNGYLIDNDRNKILQIYVFASEDERKKAKLEYNDKTAAILLTYREIHEKKEYNGNSNRRE